MEYDLPIKNGIVIPGYELDFAASRSSGPGGQHVNKTSSRITLRWNIVSTTCLTEEQKQHVLEKLYAKITQEGDIIINVSESRSQHKNKEIARARLAKEIAYALYVPKKRMKTRISKTVKEKRLQTKAKRSEIKKLRKVEY